MFILQHVAIDCVLEMACEKEMASCVRGYHIYKDIWAAAIGEDWCVEEL